MKNKQLFTMNNSLSLLDELRGEKFAYAIAKNQEKIEREIKILQKVLKNPSEDNNIEHRKYENERLVLAKKHSVKDKKNKPVITQNNYVIEDIGSWTKDFDALKEEYKKILDERKDIEKRNNEILEIDCEIEFHKIIRSDVPADISPKQYKIIIDMITEGPKLV